MQVILRQLGDCNIRRAEISDLIPVMEINLKTLPEHYSDYFYESLLAEIPEAFIVAEIGGKPVGYIMCKTEYGFSKMQKERRETDMETERRRYPSLCMYVCVCVSLLPCLPLRVKTGNEHIPNSSG